MMLDFEPTGMAIIAQWLTQNWLPFAAGLIVGAVCILADVAVQITRLRREGIL